MTDAEKARIARLAEAVERMNAVSLAKVWVPPHPSVTPTGDVIQVDGYWRTGKGGKAPDLKTTKAKSAPKPKAAPKAAKAVDAAAPKAPKAAKESRVLARFPNPSVRLAPKGLASPPTRASGSMTISFGVVSLPVQFFSSTEEGGVKRNRFSPAGNPIKMQNVDSVTGEVVEFGDLKSLYTTEDGTKVELSDEEMASAGSIDGSGTAKVLGVLPNSLLGEYQQTGLLQVRPAPGSNKKPSPANEKAFALLSRALEEEDSFALIQYTSRGKPRAAALTGDGYLRVLAYDEEVRMARPIPSLDVRDEAGQKELDMARQLVSALRTDARIDLPDTASEKIREYAEAKAKGQAPSMKPAPDQSSEDLMAALEASLASVKKSA